MSSFLVFSFCGGCSSRKNEQFIRAFDDAAPDLEQMQQNATHKKRLPRSMAPNFIASHLP
jgi:hypothetical protein